MTSRPTNRGSRRNPVPESPTHRFEEPNSMDLRQCLRDVVSCLDKQPEHRLLVIGILVAVVVPVGLFVAQDVFKVRVWQTIWKGVRWLFGVRLTHVDKVTRKQNASTVEYSESPFTPERKKRRWHVAAEPYATPTSAVDITGMRFGSKIIYHVPLYVSTSGAGEIPAYVVELHVKPGYSVTSILDNTGLRLGPATRSELTTEHNFWNKASYRVMSPNPDGVPTKIGYLDISTYSIVPANLEIPWRISLGGGQYFPESSYAKFTVHFIEPIPEIPEQPPAPYENN